MDDRQWSFGDHIVLNTANGGRLECRNCGTSYEVSLPASLSTYLVVIESFGNKHKNCKPQKGGSSGISKRPPGVSAGSRK